MCTGGWETGASMSSVTDRVAELAPSYNAILDAFEDGDDWDASHIQAVGYKLRSMLEEHNMAYWTRVPPGQAGVHPDNRDQEMLVPIAVWELICIVATLKGWDPSQLKGALACELPPAGRLRERALRANVVLHEKAADLLAPLDPDTIKVLTAASSHMTAALRLVNYAGECAMVAPDLGSEYDISLLLDNGKLSKAKVEQTCPGISEYLRDGISYFTVRYPLAELCPSLMKILSASDNAGHDTFRKESWLQLLMSLHAKATASEASTEEDWTRVGKATMRGTYAHNSSATI